MKTIKVDIRIIAATNSDLQAAVKAGTFRSDLFYRLNVVPIHIPPLRERREDLIQLADCFLRKISSRHSKNIASLPADVISAFVSYDWPGNIRELENVMERMIVMSETETLGLDEVPEEIRGVEAKTGTSALKEKIDDISRATERQMICDALIKTGQNRTKAAELLGISRRTLQTKIKEYSL